MLYIGEDQILACTAGQVNHGTCSLGVNSEGIKEFIKQLKINLPSSLTLYLESPSANGPKYYGENWRKYYESFMGRLRLNHETVFHKLEKDVIDMPIKTLKIYLHNSLKEAKIDSNDMNPDPIDLTIDSFKKYYGEKCGVENLLEQDRNIHNPTHQILKLPK